MSNVTQQSGASSSTPSGFKRWFQSKVLNYLGSEGRLRKLRLKREALRKKQARPHVVEYFHQVDDGYSHLAIQILARLVAEYDIELVFHLVPALRDDNFPEPDLWQEMSRTDGMNIASYYGLEFDSFDTLPSKELIAKATAIFCQLDSAQLLEHGVVISKSLWRNDPQAIEELANRFGIASQQAVKTKLESGSNRRAELKHYSSATFWYEGEWYWGVDRIYHLEHRLRSLNSAKTPVQPLIADRPVIATEYPKAAEQLTLEFFVSLRSPYTAIAWDPTLKLARDSGINFVIRPVLPMVMRGVPATREKIFYLAMDVAREAKTFQSDYGNFYDPIGKPVLRGYSLYMWAETQNKGKELLAAFLKAAFARGINTNSTGGIRKVVEMAGLDWSEAKHHLEDTSWQPLLEENRLKMYEFGSWGVPSYRLLDQNGKQLLGVWGQDRLWLVAKKIQEACEL